MQPFRGVLMVGLSAWLCGAAPAPPKAGSQTVLRGESLAEACSKAAVLLAEGRMGMLDAVVPCTIALDTELLDPHQRASTYVNRGVIWFTGGEAKSAERDFDTALGVEPGLGEAYVNRGAAVLAQGRTREGLGDIDRGLALGPREPWKAYFNRGVGLEQAGDVRGAYESYRKAAELMPGWVEAERELARFTVRPPG